jgi:hypothetical protein
MPDLIVIATDTLLEAKLRGREAGRLELAGGLNPYPAGSLEALTWQAERLLVVSERMLARSER